MTVIVSIVVIVVVVAGIVAGVAQANDDKKHGVIASFSGLRLTPTELIDGRSARAARYPLSGVVARVEDSGTLNRRMTMTRMALIGPFALAAKKKQDDREVYLTIEGPEVAVIRTVPMKKDKKAGTRAREFAAKVNMHSRQLGQEPAA